MHNDRTTLNYSRKIQNETRNAFSFGQVSYFALERIGSPLSRAENELRFSDATRQGKQNSKQQTCDRINYIKNNATATLSRC